MSTRDGIAALRAGTLVVAGPGCGTPLTLLRRLAVQAERTPGVTLRSGLLLGEYEFLPAVKNGDLRYETWHVGGPARALASEGVVGYIPARASSIPVLLRRWKPDVALLRVTPPSRTGVCNLGPAVSYARTLAMSAGYVIGEVDPSLPRTCGDADLPVEVFDELVETEDATPSYHSGTTSEVSRAIGEQVLGLLPPDPTLQVGIGATSEAFLSLLVEHQVGKLRFVGLAIDAVADLAEEGLLLAGAVTPEPAVLAPEVLGTSRLMEFIRENPSVGLYPSERSHDAGELGTIPRFVSLQGALEIDLAGRVASEGVAGRRIAGVGGSVDYAEAARRSPGGLRIVALPASSGDGQRSRVVPQLAAAETTLPCYLVDVVVTEYGVARLEGLSVEERAEAMIEVAAPAHRSSLRAASKSLGELS